MIDRSDLEHIAGQYLASYVRRAPEALPAASDLRFSENGVLLDLPDGSWDTVTEIVGEPLVLSDPQNSAAAIFTSVMQSETPGHLAVRLKVEEDRICEVEHILSTRRNLSSPPTPFEDPGLFTRDPDFARAVPDEERSSREVMIGLANGYFSTLENNTGELRGVRFSPDAVRLENGKPFPDVEADFRLGRYRFNERVRDRDYFLVDEWRGVVAARGFIDHKGVLGDYQLTDGSPRRSLFREPHSWHLLEAFKVKRDMITAIEATFIAVPYYMRSPWG